MSELTKEEINQRIAEKCGWKELPIGEIWEDAKGSLARGDQKPGHANIPDYCGSLDAMHEAERWLDDKPMDVRSLWLDNLALVCDWPKTKNAAELRFETDYLKTRATAHQRAIAFLEVVG